MNWKYSLLSTVIIAVHICCLHAQELEDVRLVNGTFGAHMGRVEVQYNGTWGTICDDFWSFGDANVACKMMGFRSAVCAIPRAPFGSGTGPIWMDNLRCSGRETTLEDCPFNGWGIHSCTHLEDGGAICAADDVVEPLPTPELIGSTTTSLSIQWTAPPLPEGIIALRFRVQYETDDAFPFPRNLFVSANLFDNKTNYNATITRLSRDTVYTIRVRAEVRYRFCFSYLYGNFSEDFTASTNATVGPSSIQVRLIPPDPSTPFMGRLEVFHDNRWGTVCDDFFSLTEARVVCGMLNHTNALCSVPRARFGEGKDPIWMDDVSCRRGEEVLDQCTFRGWGVHNCQHNDDVGVICIPDDIGTVANFSIAGVGSTSVTLKWEPFSFPQSVAFARYRIQYRTPGSFFSRTVSVSSTLNQYTVQRLLFGATYTFSIRAEMRFSACFIYLNTNYGDQLNATTKETEPTGPPTDFHAVVLNSTAILVEWDLPLSTFRNGIIRGYRIFVQPQGEEEMTINITGNDTDLYVLTGLQPRTAYVISALAYTVGDGPRSIHLTVITEPTGFVPFIVTFGIFGNGIDRATRFTFQRDTKVFCGSGISDATLDWFFANGTKVGTENRFIREGHYENGTAVLEIANGRRHILCDAGTYICVANSSSSGIHSKNFTLTIGTIPPAPTRPSLIKAGSTWLSIAWDDPECDGGHRIIAFDIEYTKPGIRFPFLGDRETIRIDNGSARSYTIRNLDSNTQYSIRVGAISADFRRGALSPSNLINTLPAAPSQPRKVRVRLVTPLIVEVSWREPAVPNGHIIHYTVYAIPIVQFEPERRRRQAVIDFPGTIKKIFPASSTQGNITLPNHSVTYQFQLTASVYIGGQENEGNFSAITPESTIHIPKPGLPIPQDVQVAMSDNTSVTLLWNYPPPPAEPIINFKITYSGAVASLDEESGERTSISTMIKISPLTPDTTYQFRVSAITQQGQGAEVTIYGNTTMPEGEKLAFFQIRIGPIQNCLEWHDEDVQEDRIDDIRSSLRSTLSSQCQCSLTTAHITNEELSCRGGLVNQIVYRARILGTSNYSASALVELMQSWVTGGQASVNIGASRLQIDPTCPVFLDNLLAPDCPLPPTEPPTIPTTSSSTTPTVTSTTEPPSSPTTSTTESPTSPTTSTTESPTSPTTSTTESPTSPTTSTTESPTSPTTSTTESPTSPTTSTTESPTSPTTSTTESPTGPMGIGTSPQPSVSSTKISPGEIGGIVVGVLIAVLLSVLIILLAGLFVRNWKSGQSISLFRQKKEDKTPFANIGDLESSHDTHHDSGIYEADSGLKEKPTTVL